MKTNCWLLLGTMLATSAVAQVNTNKLPEIPPPATAPAAAPATPATTMVAPAETKTNEVKRAAVHKKKTVKKAKLAAKATAKSSEKKSEAAATPAMPVTLVPGSATVSSDHVNLRGQAGLKGEVVGHVQKGETVNVISEITLDKPKAGEPAQWAKISLPTSAKVWVDSKYIDATNKVVTAKKLNLRGGPGENYSVLGVIEKGTSVTPVTTKEHWTQIETPSSAFAFVAANLLKQEAGAQPTLPTVATTEPVPPQPAPTPVVPPTPTTVPENPTIAPPAATPPTPEVAQVPPTQPAPETAMNVPTPTPTLAPAPEIEDTNPPPRIVTHEGTVRPSVSPVAPTYFELYDTNDSKAINYLFSSSTNLNLARYNGLHITVTGEEGLDPRWKDTPVLTIQKIYVLSGTPKPEPAPATDAKPTKKHWWQK